jgi:hypothetical protein
VALPRDGLNVRDDPSIDSGKKAIFNGSFVEASGKTFADPKHNVWMQVSGTDMNDDPVKGWVEARYLAPHPQGALDGTGGIDPKGSSGYTAHVVAPGQTVYEIAAQYGVSVSALENVNGQHIIYANLIFPGDVVYVPPGRLRTA